MHLCSESWCASLEQTPRYFIVKSSLGDAAQLAVTPLGCKSNRSSWPTEAGGEKSSLKRRGEPQRRWLGKGWGLIRHLESRNIPRIRTRACIQNRRVYYGPPNEAAVSDFKVTRPRGEPRNYYFIIFKRNLSGQYLLAAGTTKWAKEISEWLTFYLWY